MRTSKFDHRVKIQLNTATKAPPAGSSSEDAFGGAEDSFGGELTGWEDAATVWANVEYASGREARVGVAQEQANLPVTVTVRAGSLTDNLSPLSHRLHFDGKEWDIESIVPSRERRRTYAIIARARV